MTITIELTPDEVALLQSRADATGITVEMALHNLIATLAPAKIAAPAPNVGALMNSLRGVEEIEDPEDRAEWEREQAEIRANVARWRAEQESARGI